MKFLKWLAATSVLIISATASVSAQAADAWNADLPSVPAGQTQLFIAETGVGQNSSTRFMMPAGVGSTEFAYLCPDGVTDDGGPCDPVEGKNSFNFSSGLPACQDPTEENCVQQLSVFSGDDTEVAAKFIRQVKGTTFSKVNESAGLYRAGTESLWQVADPADPNKQLEFVVSVTAKGGYDNFSEKYFTEFLEASVTPYRIVTGSQFSASNLKMENVNGKDQLGGWAQSMGATCAWVEDGQCGKPVELAEGLKIKLAIRASSQITGWFKGRIDSPQVQVKEFSTRNVLIEMTAKSTSIPRFALTVNPDSLTETQRSLIKNTDVTGNDTTAIRSTPPDRLGMNGKFLSFEWLDAFRELTKDTAIAKSTVWNFSTIRNSSGLGCASNLKGVLGVVSTNATAFTGVMPTFQDGMLSYQVAGLHYAPDGKTLNEGTYDLIMRSDFARCLYGFSKAPISATISVISDSGENKVATTNVGEKNGWLSLRAYGFTYSAPTISVKLTQGQPKKTTITCVKGKVSKKVTAVTPKCPTGYKKR
jgi:hypothetical protein